MTLTTRELKALYRKSVAGYLANTRNPVKREMYLRMSYGIKVDLARRIKFRSKKFQCWKRIVSTITIAKQLASPYFDNSEGTILKGLKNEKASNNDRRIGRTECLHPDSDTDLQSDTKHRK